MLALLLVLALVLAGCSSPPPEEKPAPPPPAASTAPVASGHVSTLELPKPGSRRALIYTWRDRFPMQAGTFLLAETEYVKTEDLANAWRVLYASTDGKDTVELAACEYPSDVSAHETFDRVKASVTKFVPLAVPDIEAAGQGMTEDAGVAFAVSGRYVWVFKRPGRLGVPEELVQAVMKACLNGG